MPTETRSALVLSRVKGDFRANATEKDPEEIESMIQLAEVQVDNLEVWGKIQVGAMDSSWEQPGI